MSDLIRVLIVDDHAIVRSGLRALLDTEPDIQVVGEAADGRQAVAMSAQFGPDVILMDLEMPVMDGIEAIREIAAAEGGSRILVLTSFATDDKVFPAIKAGAIGYMLKSTGPKELTDAIRRVDKGESSLDPLVARKLLEELARPPAQPKAEDPLTQREEEVLLLIAKGYSNMQIATELVISETTVRSHVSNILGKLHLASRTQAALYALREGIAPLDDEPQGD